MQTPSGQDASVGDAVLDCGSPLPLFGFAEDAKAPEDWRSPKVGTTTGPFIVGLPELAPPKLV